MRTNWGAKQSGGWACACGGAVVLLIAACGGTSATGGGAGGGAGSSTEGGGAGTGAATGGSGGLPPGATCTPGESKFALCGANFLPDGDCVCDATYREWECPQVGCNPCPAERVDPACDPATDSVAVLYAKEPGNAAHCCTYTDPCATPEGWSVYATARECMRASN